MRIEKLPFSHPGRKVFEKTKPPRDLSSSSRAKHAPFRRRDSVCCLNSRSQINKGRRDLWRFPAGWPLGSLGGFEFWNQPLHGTKARNQWGSHQKMRSGDRELRGPRVTFLREGRRKPEQEIQSPIPVNLRTSRKNSKRIRREEVSEGLSRREGEGRERKKDERKGRGGKEGERMRRERAIEN